MGDSPTRRRVLLGTASVGLAATSGGCVRRARSILGRQTSDQVSLSLTCVPAEEDTFPAEIVSYFRDNLETAGIETTVNYRSYEEFRIDVLLNHDFDIAVGRLPVYPDPDAMYGLFHSSFVPERGWQNPYGFSNVELDEVLAMQRRDEGQRREHVYSALEILAGDQAIAPLVFPVEHRFVRSDRYDGFRNREFKSATDLLSLSPDEQREELRFGIGFTAPTRNLNPLSVEHRTEEIVTGLVYDSIVRRVDGKYVPWLAADIDWSGQSALVRIREGEWHDGEPVTAADVAFTYRLLQDTLLESEDSASPAPVYRGRMSLVDTVTAHDDRTVEFEFTTGSDVANRALTVPVLPEHVWEDRTETADVSGIVNDSQITEAVVNTNIPPIGSGPYSFVDRSERDFVVLELVDDHFLPRGELDSTLTVPATEIHVVVAPSGDGALEDVQRGDLDFTLSPIPPEDMDVESTPETEITRTASRELYHIGYNARTEPLSNGSFRRQLSRLVDKSWIAATVFDGEAIPATTPFLDGRWVPDSLKWDGRDPEVPFIGSDGTLDEERMREAFLEIGYQYGDDGVLRVP